MENLTTSPNPLQSHAILQGTYHTSHFDPINYQAIQVLASNKSHSALKIRKNKISPSEQRKNEPNLNVTGSAQVCSNSKRELETNRETNKYQNSIKKRTNSHIFHYNSSKQSKQLKVKEILQVLKEQNDDFFCLQKLSIPSQTNDYYNANFSCSSIVFPDSNLPLPKQTNNELLVRNIEIMSNTNQKISIPIHEGLYKSNTSHKNQCLEDNQNIIPNLCDFKMKNQYSQSIQFIREYKSGYIPIQMQKRNNQEVVIDKKDLLETPTKGNKDKTRNHFIRKQQSTLTLPRTCGVSYIKPSQSLLTQKQPFEPLPPLIFQGSTSCCIGANGQTINSLNQQKKELINKFNIALQNQWLPFIVSDQDEMRDLLLGKRTKNAKVGFVQGIQNLWPLYVEGSFILIMISPKKLLLESEVWEAFQNKLNYFKIGILSKKSTSGKKAFLKSIKTDKSDNSSVMSFQTNQHDLKQEINTNIQFNKGVFQNENRFSFEMKDSSSEEKKVSSTLDQLEEQLKDCRTVITMSLRLEMYVQENDWLNRLTKENKDILNEIITSLKDKLEKKSIRVICQRFQLGRESKSNPFEQKFNFLRKGKINQETRTLLLIKQKPQNLQTIPPIENLLQKQDGNFKLSSQNKEVLLAYSEISSPSDFLKSISNEELWKKTLKFPIYYISTRDSFAFDLIEKKTILRRSNGRQYTRINYYFYPDNVPANFGSEYRKLFPQLDIGVTAYHGFFTEQELKQFQDSTFSLEKKAFKNKFLQMTVQPSIVSTKIKRTKFFFGYRYMWTRCQLSQPCSYVGAGVRKDVASRPSWTNKISDQMVKQNIVEKDFINSIAINVYHDGKQGLAQHFDDAVRFKQPIYTLRLFSDARLSFGSQFYGFCNGAFIIPLPRGCILVMEQNSYAANGVKHCVRPCDMTGKSAAVILRQMHSQVVSEASRYDELIDFPAWFSCLSEKDNSITFAEQKRLEAEQIMKVKVD